MIDLFYSPNKKHKAGTLIFERSGFVVDGYCKSISGFSVVESIDCYFSSKGTVARISVDDEPM